MNRRFVLTWLLVIIPIMLMAQDQGGRFNEYLEKFKAEKVAFLTQKLDLEVLEAEKFWPVYNEYQTKIEKIKRESRPTRRMPNPDSLSNSQMKKMMDTKIQNELKMAELVAVYHEKFNKILPVKKIFILYHGEQQFMSFMIKKMRESGDFGRRSDGRKGSDGNRNGSGRDH